MSNTVRAKVLCTQITVDPDFGHSSLYFSAVCSDDPETENAAFTDATPHLTLAMTIASGKPAAQLFEQGQEYYLDFTRVAAVVDPRQTSIEDSSPLVRSAVVYGPQGCGKTTNTQALAQHLNLETVIDGWDGLTAFPTFGALVLTDLSRSQLVRLLADRRAQIIDFYDVMRSAKLSAPCMPAVVDPRQTLIEDAQEQRDGQYATQAAEADGIYPSGRGDPTHGELNLLNAEAADGFASAHNRSPPTAYDAGNASSCGSDAQDGGSADCSASGSGGGSSGD